MKCVDNVRALHIGATVGLFFHFFFSFSLWEIPKMSLYLNFSCKICKLRRLPIKYAEGLWILFLQAPIK